MDKTKDVYISTIPTSLQNTADASQATIRITPSDAGWDKAYTLWLQGKNPTKSKEWKAGVFCCCGWVLKNSPAGTQAAKEKQLWYEKYLKPLTL